jgi:hypothetical protein
MALRSFPTAARRRRGWLGRGILAGLLLAGIFLPAQASGQRAPGCRTWHCGAAGKVRWARPLGGSWTVRSAILGTVPAQTGGQAYSAAGHGLAVLGFGLTIHGYHSRDGDPLWTANLTGFPARIRPATRCWSSLAPGWAGRRPGRRARSPSSWPSIAEEVANAAAPADRPASAG